MFRAMTIFLLFLPVLESADSKESEKCPLENMKIMCHEKGGTLNPYCSQKMSSYCSLNHGLWPKEVPKMCFNTLSQEIKGCDIKPFRPGDLRCGSIRPQHITPLNESLVQLRLYHFSSHVWESEALVNLTFPNRTWQELEFQSEVMSSKVNPICLRYTLNQPINHTLMFDCRFRAKRPEMTQPIEFTVQTESGVGATYIFQVPIGPHVDPQKTCPTEWHTFFYIHKDAIQPFLSLPVTVQSAPFGMVDYRVSLARCPVAEDEKCSTFVEEDYVIERKNTSDDLWTVELSPVWKGGNYTVRVQIVSDWCHTTNSSKGCYIAVSPKFIIPDDFTWVVLVVFIIVIILSVICVVLIIWTRRKVNKEFFRSLATKQTTVLLVYHPESQTALEFVQKLAEFLRNFCGITPLMMDNDVFLQNPTTWLKTCMKEAHRVLFIIPMNAEVPSCTPFTFQWATAMSECSGSDFIANPKRVRCLAKLVHPKSGVVPCEISNIQRFDLSHSPATLANWLHSGSYLDQFLIWLPHFRSATYMKTTPNWAHVSQAAQKIGLPPTDTEKKDKSCPTPPSGSVSIKGTKIDNVDWGEGDDNEVDDYNDVDDVFDPDIPNVDDELCDPHDVNDPFLVDLDDNDLDVFVGDDVG